MDDDCCSLSYLLLLGNFKRGCVCKDRRSRIVNCRSVFDAAVATVESTPEFRSLRLVDEGAFGEVDTYTKNLDLPSLYTSLGLNSIADGPDKPDAKDSEEKK